MVWYVNPAGQRIEVTSLSQARTLSGSVDPIILTVAAGFVAGLPLGPAIVHPGELVRQNSASTIYLVDGENGLIPISSLDYVSALGLPTTVVTVSPATVSSRTIAGASLGSVVSCSGSLFVAGSGNCGQSRLGS